jgi:hypothetical protein
MGRQSKYIEFPFNAGLDTKNEPKLVQPPALLTLENAVFSDYSIQKRNGGAAHGITILGGGNLSAAQRITTRASELVTLGGTSIHAYAGGIADWIEVTSTFEPIRLSSNILSGQITLSGASGNTRCAENSDVMVVSDGSGRYAVYDVDTLTVLLPYTDTGGFIYAVVETTTHVVVIYNITSEFYTKAISSSDLTPSGVASGFNDVSLLGGQYGGLDADAHITSDGIVYAYSATSETRFGYIDNDGSWGGSEYSASVTSAEDAEFGLHVVSNGDTTVVAFYEITSELVRFWAMDTSFGGATYNLTPGTATTIEATSSTPSILDRNIGIIFTDSVDNFDIYFDQGNGGNGLDSNIRTASYSGVSQTVAPSTFMHNAVVGSHPFTEDGTQGTDYLLWAMYPAGRTSLGTDIQATAFLVNTSAEVAGRTLASLSVTEFLTRTIHQTALGSGRFTAQTLVSPTNFVDGYSTLISFDYAATQEFSSIEYGGSLYISGAMVWQYDGERLYEAGIMLTPELESVSYGAGNSDMDTDLTYTWSFFWEHTDAGGKRIQSAANVFQASPTADTATFIIETLAFTNKDVQLAVYRSEGNGTIRYRAGSMANDKEADTITFVDEQVDGVTLIDNEVDATSVGVLDQVAPFPSHVMLAHDDRIFLAADMNRDKVYFSKRPSSSDQPGFNEGLVIQLPQDNDEVTGLGVLDNKLVIFKRDLVYIVTGEGPNNLGSGSFYSLPRLIATDVGCKDQRSIVRTPDGVMFQSDKGMYLITRGEQAVYIGEAVEAFNSQTVTSAVLVADNNEVRFTTDSGNCLTYDYKRRAWTTTDYVALDATMQGQTYTTLRTSSIIRTETQGAFLNDDTSYDIIAETAWIKPAGAMARFSARRFALLGEFPTATSTKVDVYVDYVDTINNTFTFQNASGATIEEFASILAIQSVRAVKFKITHSTDVASADLPFKLNILALEISGRDLIDKLQSSKVI